MLTSHLTFAQFCAAVRRKGGLALCLALCTSGLGLTVSAQEPRFTTIDAPGADMTAGSLNGTYPQALNDIGVIAGAYNDSSGGLHGFVRTPDGKITTFDAPGTVTGANAFTNPRSLNLEGLIVGGFFDAENKIHGFRRSPDGKFTTFVAPGECTTSVDVGCHGTGAWDINNFGTIVGAFEDNSGNFVAHTFIRFPDGKFTTFAVPGSSQEAGQGTTPATSSGLNQWGAITGTYYDANNAFHGFLRNPDGTFIKFEAPGADTTTPFNGTFPQAINDCGAITGFYLDVNQVYHGFVRSPEGKFTTFDALGADTNASYSGTYPSNINLFGAIAGDYLDANGVIHGFVRSPDGNFTTFDAPGADTNAGDYNGTFPSNINFSGEITGSYIDVNNVYHGFIRKP
jgi:hypothetical protein